jgi:hypothetical protein
MKFQDTVEARNAAWAAKPRPPPKRSHGGGDETSILLGRPHANVEVLAAPRRAADRTQCFGSCTDQNPSVILFHKVPANQPVASISPIFQIRALCVHGLKAKIIIFTLQIFDCFCTFSRRRLTATTPLPPPTRAYQIIEYEPQSMRILTSVEMIPVATLPKKWLLVQILFENTTLLHKYENLPSYYYIQFLLEVIVFFFS